VTTGAETTQRFEISEIDDELTSLFDSDFLSDMNAQSQLYADPREFLGRPPSDIPTGVIIYDLMYPNSYDVKEGLKRIPELREAFPQALLIVHTGTPLENVRRRAKELGANAVLQKSRDNPEFIRDLIRLAMGREVVKASTLCEVVEVDEDNGRIRVEVSGRDGWIAERSFDIDFCPMEARQLGGAFWIDSIEKRRGAAVEYVVRARAVDILEEQEFLQRFPE
jgi:CheY-like chemotaxis protein